MDINVSNYSQEELLAFLERRHPEYWERLVNWDFFEETYEGGQKWFANNIHKYIKEGEEEFAERVLRGYRFNHTRESVDLINKYIFKSDVARNYADAPEWLTQFWEDATLSHQKIEQFMRLISTKASVSGRIWVFVDSTKTDDVQSIADQKENGDRCYAYIIGPRDVLDVGFDEQGETTWMLVREHVRDDVDPIRSTGMMRQRYRLWTRTSWTLFEIQDKNKSAGTTVPQVMPVTPPQSGGMQMVLPAPGVVVNAGDNGKIQVVQVGQGVNPLGRMPCFPVDNVIGDNKYHAPALIEDTAYLDKAVANYLSNLDAIIQDQTFSQLMMPAQNVLPGEAEYDALVRMGTKRVFLYDGESAVAPSYISPDVKQAELIITVVNKIINEIYHSLGMGGERTKQDNAVGIDNSSGVAKAYDFERLNSLLTTKSESLENCEDQLIELLAAWNNADVPGLDDDDGEGMMVVYADTFDVRSLYDEFTVAERLDLIEAPDLVRQQQMKQFVEKLFPALKADLKKQMFDQIETAWPINTADQVQIQGVMAGNPTATFPAKLTATSGSPPMIPQVPPAAAGGKGPASTSNQRAKKAARKGVKAQRKTKNKKTASRQGQVTSETK